MTWHDWALVGTLALIGVSVVLNVELGARLHEQCARNRELAEELKRTRMDRYVAICAPDLSQLPGPQSPNGHLPRTPTHGDTFIRRSK